MFKLLKIFFYALIVLVIGFLYWFLPKYNFIHKNPQYCVKISDHIYYCGTNSNIDKFYNLFSK